jgi:hypothetical protein
MSFVQTLAAGRAPLAIRLVTATAVTAAAAQSPRAAPGTRLGGLRLNWGRSGELSGVDAQTAFVGACLPRWCNR